MKSLPIVLATALALAAAPIALAAEGTCNPTPETSYIKHPTKAGSYLYLDVTSPNKIEQVGEWVETNGKLGLQTEMCYRNGVLRYIEDTPVAILP